MYHNFFIHLSVDGQVGCFHVLAIVNMATMNLCIFQLWFSQGICPIVRFLGHMVVLFLGFKGNFIIFSIVAVSIYFPTNRERGYTFLHTFSIIYCL